MNKEEKSKPSKKELDEALIRNGRLFEKETEYDNDFLNTLSYSENDLMTTDIISAPQSPKGSINSDDEIKPEAIKKITPEDKTPKQLEIVKKLNKDRNFEKQKTNKKRVATEGKDLEKMRKIFKSKGM